MNQGRLEMAKQEIARVNFDILGISELKWTELVCGLAPKPCLTLVTPWTVACQAHLAIGFSEQECWRGLPFPSPGDLPGPSIEPRSPVLPADSLPTEL